jgi:hypothetical protein
MVMARKNLTVILILVSFDLPFPACHKGLNGIVRIREAAPES